MRVNLLCKHNGKLNETYCLVYIILFELSIFVCLPRRHVFFFFFFFFFLLFFQNWKNARKNLLVPFRSRGPFCVTKSFSSWRHTLYRTFSFVTATAFCVKSVDGTQFNMLFKLKRNNDPAGQLIPMIANTETKHSDGCAYSEANGLYQIDLMMDISTTASDVNKCGVVRVTYRNLPHEPQREQCTFGNVRPAKTQLDQPAFSCSLMRVFSAYLKTHWPIQRVFGKDWSD